MWLGNGKCYDGDFLKRYWLCDVGLVLGCLGGVGCCDVSVGGDG